MRINSPLISHQTIEGEVVAINLENGCYYSLLDLSAAIWQQIDAGAEREAIAESVARAYPGVPDARSQAERFIDQLLEEGLVVAGGAGSTSGAAGLPAAFTPPLLEKFTDMQELLMLDPIHEVDEQGWPHKPSES